MAKRGKVEHLVSAGGVVFRQGDAGFEVVLCGRRSPLLWALPKGTPDAGEERVETALREVTEETGLEVQSTGLIDRISYWFSSSDGTRCHKNVYFYLMEATGGDTSNHDHEFDDVRWFPVDEALRAMTYKNEAKIVEKGLSLASEKG